MNSNKVNLCYFGAFNDINCLAFPTKRNNCPNPRPLNIFDEKLPPCPDNVPQVDGLDDGVVDQPLAMNLHSHPLFAAAMPHSAPPSCSSGTTFSFPKTSIRQA